MLARGRTKPGPGFPDFDMRRFVSSFRYAFKGVQYAFNSQLNFKLHFFAALFAVVLGCILDITRYDWLWIGLAVALVIMAELFNTALEELVNLVSPAYHPLAGKVKDMASAAVLCVAVLAAIIGFVIFVPRILG